MLVGLFSFLFFMFVLNTSSGCKRYSNFDYIHQQFGQENIVDSVIEKSDVITFSKWPETTLRRVLEHWKNPGHQESDKFYWPQKLQNKYSGYEGLLLSTCISVRMFEKCGPTPSELRGQRRKVDYRSFYGIPKIRTEWSTFDRFELFDCSEKSEKWTFFTGEGCHEVLCNLKTNCDGIQCNCCEEIRCLRPKTDLSVLDAFTNGSVRIKNCFNIYSLEGSHQNSFSQKCIGDCNKVDKVNLERYLNVSCGFISCFRQLMNCEGFTCRCCDVITCVPDSDVGKSILFSQLLREDQNVIHFANFYKMENSTMIRLPDRGSASYLSKPIKFRMTSNGNCNRLYSSSLFAWSIFILSGAPRFF